MFSGRRFEFGPVLRARAHRLHRVACRWIHVIVHRDNHRDEYERVVDKVQLDSRNPDLTDTGWNVSTKPVAMCLRLIKQDEMLEVMPELNPERNHPPLV